MSARLLGDLLAKRNSDLILRYIKCNSTKKVADEFAISVQRVRQIISKHRRLGLMPAKQNSDNLAINACQAVSPACELESRLTDARR